MRNLNKKMATNLTAGATALILALGLIACSDQPNSDATEAPRTPGITDEYVRLGSSAPRSGPASAYRVISDSLQVYLEQVNEAGGVKMADGKTRKIEYVAYDDSYMPDKAVTSVRRLVNNDQVFAVFGIVGTATNLAVRDYLNNEEIPQLFADSPSSQWGDVENYPWTRGFQPSFGTEAAVYAEYMKSEFPNGKVAILSQNDDYGLEFVTWFKQAIEGSGLTIVAHETYEMTDPTVAPQVTKLAESEAEIFLNISTPKASAQAIAKSSELGWNALHFLNRISAHIGGVFVPAGVDNAKGIVSAQFFKDPLSEAWQDNKDMKQFKKAVEAAGVNSNDALAVHGWIMAQLLVNALERMEEPTRAAFIESVNSYDAFAPKLMLPGITVNTSADDPFAIESLYLQQFDGKQWVRLSDEPVSFEGESTVFRKN
ncbi:ABC transporter substrate-binding protein [Alcanivorax marinus]|uniref:ABC transporter substrate-binding protein n=1 Tax=Alloalcanivorax marinus TaxID=1177169 RepID=A0A9Q3URR4_9GAMM|nr:ABC transporter substrate-binding protein [Alloalcanivorax marinus]MCC4310429.1 ABC transporter substrate-binding protein [Alloalcanivorax marinus]MCU5785572.1 putative leucine/isoleucine/valine-binding protein [Alloalcanivorax marinus]